jgi:hypothetical protein
MPGNFFRIVLACFGFFAMGLVPSLTHAQTAFGLTAASQLVRFDAAAPGTILATVPITGLVAGDTLVAIDFRPADGALFALGSGSRIYTVNTTTGAATQVGVDGAFTLAGTAFGFDFNPTVDRIRVVSDADQNQRLNPNNGTLAGLDTLLSYAAGDPNFGVNPNVAGSAYGSNVAGSPTTTLYAIDTNLDVLAIQNPPNAGVLNTVGALGVNTSAVLGFDIRTVGGVDTAYAALQVGATSGLYTINLATGAATLVGNFPGGTTIVGLAMAPAGVLQFSSPSYSVGEAAGSVTVTVQRTGGSFGAVSATLATTNASATAPGDYTAVSTPVSFADGDTAPKNFAITIVNDVASEGLETFTVGLSAATGGASLGPNATVAIIDDDGPSDAGYAITAANQLIRFGLAAPSAILSSVPITGLVAGDTPVAIDFRPADGALFALGSGSRIYTVNTTTGAATQVGVDGAFTLAGTAFGFDFNPTVDRIRVVSDADQNQRLNPNNGTLAGLDTLLSYAAGDPNFGVNPNVAGSAYGSNVAGSPTTTLYAIDTNLDVLAIQNPPNAGVLNTVGALGVNTSAVLGFDIRTVGGVDTAYAALQVGATSGLYTINLATGAATLVGNFPAGTVVTGLALAAGTPPVITSAATTTFTVGTAGTFTVTATGVPAPTFFLAGTLPAGVTFTPATGVLSGTPGAGTAGTYPLTITASNGVLPDAAQSFSLVVAAAGVAPAITSAATTTFTVGVAGTFTVTATGSPAPTLALTGALPAGVTFTPATGVLGGTPGAGTAGTYPLTITASNATPPNATQSFSLVVAAAAVAPAITSAGAATFIAGTPGTFTITATGSPAPTLSLTGALPAGVTFNPATGVLSGTPGIATAGTYPVTITASNGTPPNATQALAITVLAASASGAVQTPTLSEWALFVLALLIATFGMRKARLRTQRQV